MKYTLTLILSLNLSWAGVGDSAGGGEQLSWNDIKKSLQYLPDGPVVLFDTISSGTKMIPLIDTCYIEENDLLKTVKKQRIYQRRDRGEWRLLGKKHLFTKRLRKKEVCTGIGQICQWEETIIPYPLRTQIDVRATPRGDFSFGPILFKKDFEVPDCE